MSKTPEGAVKEAVKKLLAASHVYFFSPATAGYGTSGVPDIVCCVQSHFLAVECKAGNNKPTALQERELQRIRDAGGTAMVVNEANIDTLAAWLEHAPVLKGNAS